MAKHQRVERMQWESELYKEDRYVSGMRKIQKRNDHYIRRYIVGADGAVGARKSRKFSWNARGKRTEGPSVGGCLYLK